MEADQRRAKASKVTDGKGKRKAADFIFGDAPGALKKATCVGPILRERFSGSSARASGSSS